MNKKLILGIGILVMVAIVFLVWFMPQTETGEIIKIKKGDTFSIVLGSNPSTGYQWELEFDSEYIQLANKKHTPSALGVLGAGSEDTFEFFALKSGKTKITFSYLRPWLKDEKSALQKKVFKVIIE